MLFMGADRHIIGIVAKLGSRPAVTVTIRLAGKNTRTRAPKMPIAKLTSRVFLTIRPRAILRSSLKNIPARPRSGTAGAGWGADFKRILPQNADVFSFSAENAVYW